MTNPFEKRATEYLRDESAFLSVVTPEPLATFFKKHASSGALYDRLCFVIGTPGSGKTTIARLLEYKTVHKVINSPNHPNYYELKKELLDCGVVGPNNIKVIGCRIPMESEYRDFWELPYDEIVKFRLLKSFLQARTLISWLLSLEETSVKDLSHVEVVYRTGVIGPTEELGGSSGQEVLEKAMQVEREIYRINAALISPPVNELPDLLLKPYQPFDVIVEIKITTTQQSVVLKPLVMLDDVHLLHPDQILQIRDWLVQRESRIARWMLMRLDADTPESVLFEGISASKRPEIKIQKSRELTQIWLQSSKNRRKSRRNFQKMAKSMADKYLRLMPVFSSQGLISFQALLNTQATEISNSNLGKLRMDCKVAQSTLRISDDFRIEIEQEIEGYFRRSNNEAAEDLKTAMLLILMYRHGDRSSQPNFFDEYIPQESSRSVKVRSNIADGARIHLLHKYNRPYFFGIEAVCNASAENAEQFLNLAGRLVDASASRIIRRKSAELLSGNQHKLLKTKAQEIIDNWSFPHHAEVRKLCRYISEQCVEKSLEENASLGGGANAFGIPYEEYGNIVSEHSRLALTLKFGVAYSALTLKHGHKTKNRLWTLIELTGPSLIFYGLTFTRGGFVERNVSDLLQALDTDYT